MPKSVHRINLRGTWKLEQGIGAAATAHKIRLPAEWGAILGDSSGRMRLTRTFHRPTNLDPTEVVELVFAHWPGAWVISLNQQPLAEFRDASAESPRRIAVTQLLQPTNTLSVETSLAPQSGRDDRRAPFGTIALEIRTD
jgi:hypothetical protein